MRAGHVLSLGSINVDFQVRVERWPEPGEALPGHDLQIAGGGKAANVALLAERLEHQAVLLGRVGDDDLAEVALGHLRDAGVELDRVRRVPGRRTGMAFVAVREDGDKSIILCDNANDAWSEEDTAEVVTAVEDAPRGSVLVVDLEVPAVIAGRALEAASRSGITAILDPSPAARVSRPMLRAADVITPNESEARRLLRGVQLPTDDLGALAEALHRESGGTVLLKRSSGGCLLAEGDGVYEIPAPDLGVVDATGQGDAFAGALAVALAEGRKMPEAARFAAAAAACAVTGYGAAAGAPTREEVERLLSADPSLAEVA